MNTAEREAPAQFGTNGTSNENTARQRRERDNGRPASETNGRTERAADNRIVTIFGRNQNGERQTFVLSWRPGDEEQLIDGLIRAGQQVDTGLSLRDIGEIRQILAEGRQQQESAERLGTAIERFLQELLRTL